MSNRPLRAHRSSSKALRAVTRLPVRVEPVKPLEGRIWAQTLLAIDPGPEQSAWLLYDFSTGQPLEWDKPRNELVLELMDEQPGVQCVIEHVQSYGMPVGMEVFETVLWVGRFIERWSSISGQEPLRVYRKEVKLHLCQSLKATDATIRQALMDRYGPGRERAVGKKATPGPLYGMKSDCWSALAVAITAAER